MSNVSIENVGPIPHLEVVAPEEGGLVLLLGRNESGKSTALGAISEALHQDGGLKLRRGETRGEVEAFGMRLTVGGNTRRKGELEVIEVEGLDAARAIDPGLADPLAADRERILTFCELIGVKVDPQKFAPIVGGTEELARIASPATLAAATMPAMAEGLKKDLEKAARAAKEQASSLEGKAAGLRMGLADVDLTQPADEQKLASATEAAVRALAELDGRAKQAAETQAKLGSARATLDKLREQPAVDESEAQAQLDSARAAESTATEALGAATQAVSAAEEAKAEAIRQADLAIAAAKKRQADAQSAAGAAMLATRQAQTRLEGLAKRRADIAAAELAVAQSGGSIAEAPSEDQLAAARAALEVARKAQENGAIIRRLRKQKLEADAAAREADAAAAQAAALREAALAVWDVIAECVAPILPAGMSIKDGRLRVTQGSEVFFFSDLSDGARAEIVIRATAEAMHRRADALAKQNGTPKQMPVMVFKQTFGESLDPHRILRMHQLARELGVLIYTARCDAGELRSMAAPEALASVFVSPKTSDAA